MRYFCAIYAVFVLTLFSFETLVNEFPNCVDTSFMFRNFEKENMDLS
jgi:hypothetical protein